MAMTVQGQRINAIAHGRIQLSVPYQKDRKCKHIFCFLDWISTTQWSNANRDDDKIKYENATNALCYKHLRNIVSVLIE